MLLDSPFNVIGASHVERAVRAFQNIYKVGHCVFTVPSVAAGLGISLGAKLLFRNPRFLTLEDSLFSSTGNSRSPTPSLVLAQVRHLRHHIPQLPG